RRHREPHRGGAQALHRLGPAVQRAGSAVPGEPDRDGVRLLDQTAVHGRERGGGREAAGGELRSAGDRTEVTTSLRAAAGLLLWLGLALATAAQTLQPVPPLTGRVVDLTGTLAAPQ